MSCIRTMQETAALIEREHGFTSATPLEDIALMHSELSEALEDLRNGRPVYATYYNYSKVYRELPKPEGVPSEMADVVIRIMGFCSRHGIGLQTAIEEKMAFNETRPFKHGKAL